MISAIKSISFKGIIGGINQKESDDKKQVRNYYPFADETKEETDKFIKSHSKVERRTGYMEDYSEPEYYYDDNNVRHRIPSSKNEYHYAFEYTYKEAEKLPFTKNEYKTYQKDPAELSFQDRLKIKAITEEIEREKSI